MIKIKQQVCWKKIGYSNALWLETNICKKRNMTTLISAHQAKEAMQLWQWLVGTTTGQFTWDLFGAGIKLKESVLKKNSQINFMLQPEIGFCRQSGPESSQVWDWYLIGTNHGQVKDLCWWWSRLQRSSSEYVGIVLY